jgi:transposase InsO family protein
MDSEIETVVKQCPVCKESRASPPLHPWQWPSQPWSRVHLDFAGPYMGHMFLVIVDAHSKWLDAHIMSSITSSKITEVLRSVFAIHGLPQTIVTDNGPSFTSDEFAQFMARNGIKHVKSAPYHPSSNGQAERAVQTLKLGIKYTQGGSIQERLSKFLFDYRITPHATTGIAPCGLLMKRNLRSRFDLLYPEIAERVEKRQLKQSECRDGKKELRKFAKDE